MSEEHLISIFTHMRKRLRRLAMQFLPDEEDADRGKYLNEGRN